MTTHQIDGRRLFFGWRAYVHISFYVETSKWCGENIIIMFVPWRWEIPNIILRSLRMIISDNRLSRWSNWPIGIVKLLFQYSLLTVTDFKLFWQVCFQGYSGHDPFKIFQKEGVARDAWPLHFGGLNANCSNMVTDTDFKFEKHVPWDSPDMTL